MSSREIIDHSAVLLGSIAHLNEPLGAKTTYRVGGRAALYVDISSRAVLEQVVATVGETQIDLLVLGNGSNLLVADAGFPGLALRLSGEFAQVEIDAGEGQISVGAAVSYPVLARKCATAGLSGLEWAVGIPGSVGGAVTMNAGGHGAETRRNLREARIVHLLTGGEHLTGVEDLDCSYRHTNVGVSDLVLEATFSVSPHGDRDKSLAMIEEIVAWRREHQPGGRNCGSVFTNPPGDTAGRIIEAAGLKGVRKGTAQVSDKHANFIQADDDGSADDVQALIDEIQAQVAVRTGVHLETELRTVGFVGR